MGAPSFRQERLEHLITIELQALLSDEARDEALSSVRIVTVQLSADAGHARVGFAIAAPPSEERVAGPAARAALERATPFLRARLASQLNLKRTPHLGFTFIGMSGEVQ